MKPTARSLFTLGLPLLATAALPLAAARALTDWDAGRDLALNEGASGDFPKTNPNPTVSEWSYGYRNGVAGTDLTLYTPAEHAVLTSGFYAGFHGYDDTAHQAGLGVFFNGPVTLGSFEPLAANEIFTSIDDHAGVLNNVIRWTAPTDGTYNYAVKWHDLDPNGGTGAAGYLVIGGQQVFKGTWANGRGQGTQTSGSVTLKAGGVIDTLLNSNGTDSSYDTAGISIVISDANGGTGGGTHPAFFTGESALDKGAYFLRFAGGNAFGYYSYLSDPHYIYHFDLGYEYVFDAQDGNAGVYLFDFKSGGFFYTSPSFPFPYLYDFSLNAVLYYFPDPKNEGRYNTEGVRYFSNLSTGQIISK